MNKALRDSISLMLLCAAATISGQAQESATEKKPVPTLTTEAVRRSNPSALVAETVSVRQEQASQSEAAEIAWNERYRQTLARVNEPERRADQAELDAAAARNAIFARPNQPQEVNELNARVNRQTALSQNLRAEAEIARQRLDALLAEARAKGFQIRSFALFKRSGEPDPESFRERFLDLQQALRDAQARAAVLQLRTNRTFTTYRAIGCGPVNAAGFCTAPNDIFFQNRVRAELQENKAALAAAQNRITALNQQIEELKRQGLQAGLPPGLFR
jgi:hypothetical protein